MSPAASVAGADTAWTQSPARPPPQASCPAGLPPVPLPPLGSTSLGPCGPLTHSSPSPLTGMGKSSWCRFPEEGSSVPVPGTPVEGDPSTQRLRALHGGAGVHGGWRTSVPALCVVSPDEQSPLNPRGSGSVSPGKLRLRCVKDREGLPSSRAQSPF